MRGNIFAAIGREALADAVERAIRDAILSGRLAPGERLVEAKISHELGVSRAPVREALARLEQRGLVVSRAHRGTFVVRLTPEDIREIFGLRRVLEGHALSLAQAHIQPKDLVYLEELTAAMGDAARVGNVEAAMERDLEFHAYLVRLSGSRRLFGMWSNLVDQLRSLSAKFQSLYPDLNLLIESHHATVEALGEGDHQRASRLLQAHLEEAESLLLRSLEEDHA
ncbi:MAG: GntR family transcriptional regulator [Armatimonadota bacterium]|nr:GntR family transcriptional regulator [Armatimonadota bacterium]